MTMPTISAQGEIDPPIPIEAGLPLQIVNLLLAVPQNFRNCAVTRLPHLTEQAQPLYLPTNIGHSGAVPQGHHSPQELSYGNRPSKFPNEPNRIVLGHQQKLISRDLVYGARIPDA